MFFYLQCGRAVVRSIYAVFIEVHTVKWKGSAWLVIVPVVFLSRPRSEGWPHHGRTFSIYLYPLSFWLTLPQRVLSTTWYCLSRPCVVFLACVHLALFLALFLSPGNSLLSSWYDHSMLASSLLVIRGLFIVTIWLSFCCYLLYFAFSNHDNCGCDELCVLMYQVDLCIFGEELRPREPHKNCDAIKCHSSSIRV